MIPGSPEQHRHWGALIRRVSDKYLAAHGKRPSILQPRTFTEKMQWRKLFELDPRFTMISDKLAVRDFVAPRVGAARLIPMQWSGADPAAIPFERLVPPYVLKGAHAAGQTLVVKDAACLDAAAARASAVAWLRYNHGTAMHEPGYANVPPGLMVETMLFGPEGAPPIEYKVFVFDGRARVIMSLIVDDDRIGRQVAYHGPDWAPLGWSIEGLIRQRTPLPRPRQLAEMIEIAEELGRDFSHLRVDLYACADRIRVGELTLYHWSGMRAWQPEEADRILGKYWTIPHAAARALWPIATMRHDIQLTGPTPPAGRRA